MKTFLKLLLVPLTLGLLLAAQSAPVAVGPNLNVQGTGTFSGDASFTSVSPTQIETTQICFQNDGGCLTSPSSGMVTVQRQYRGDAGELAWWKLDDGDAGFLVDNTTAAPLTANSEVGITPAVNGLFTSAIQIGDSAPSWKSAPNVVRPTGDFTLWIWVRRTTYQASVNGVTWVIVPYRDTNSWTLPYISVELGATGAAGTQVQAGITTGGTFTAIVSATGSGTLILQDQPNFVALTRNATSGVTRLSLNGNVVSTSTIGAGSAIDWNSGAAGPWCMAAPFISDGTSVLVISGYAQATGWQIEDARVFGREFTLAELRTIYKNALNLPASTP